MCKSKCYRFHYMKNYYRDLFAEKILDPEFRYGNINTFAYLKIFKDSVQKRKALPSMDICHKVLVQTDMKEINVHNSRERNSKPVVFIQSICS